MIKNFKLKINNSPLRVALVHDYIKEIGGAESVLETLSELFPDAPIYTTLYRPSNFGPHKARLEKKWGSRIHQSFFRFIPFAHKLISPLRLLSPLAFRLFDFSDLPAGRQAFDLIITSATGAYFPNSLNKKTARLICYCHTPPRYLYGLPTARNLKKYPLLNALAEIANHFLRLLDFHWSQNVDQFIANSSTTASRIQKFYRKGSIIINPPVNIPKSSHSKLNKCHPELVSGSKSDSDIRQNDNFFYLTGGRLALAKRYDIAINTCNKLKLPLKVFGRDFAGYESELRAMAGPTIEFLGEVTQEEKAKLFSNALGYFFCSDNEDFGIVSVEAQGYGCPVIGYNSGGIKETVVDGKTGVLFDDLTVDSCILAVQKLQKLMGRHCERSVAISRSCFSNAQKFSKQKFVEKINTLISNTK